MRSSRSLADIIQLQRKDTTHHREAASALRLRRLRDTLGDRTYMALTLLRRPHDQMQIHEVNNLAQHYRVATAVTNDLLFHGPVKRAIDPHQDDKIPTMEFVLRKIFSRRYDFILKTVTL
jgi:DNA polymerase III alpha subunit